VRVLIRSPPPIMYSFLYYRTVEVFTYFNSVIFMNETNLPYRKVDGNVLSSRLQLSWGSWVSIMADYKLKNQGLIPNRGKGFFPWSLYSDQFWGPPSLLYHGNQRSLPRGKIGWGMMLTAHHHLMLRSRISALPLSACMACSGAGLLYYLQIVL
jgi:hypothetical protein